VRRNDEVYRAYWRFASERQRVFLRRQEGAAPPWTEDPIIRAYKFTNAYRASDRVSQFLIREVIYDNVERTAADELARIILFRLFSRPSTWQALESRLGSLRLETMRSARIVRELSDLQKRGPIYTSAFILCANNAYGRTRKFENHLALIAHMFRDGLEARIAKAASLREVYETLLGYPLIGPFMAYQLAIDINYSELLPFSENDFTVAGPGAERGIRKIFPDAHRRDFARIIHKMVEAQSEEPTRLGIELPTLYGRPLHAIDCQSLFCELDKYARAAFPELKSNRRRIKATFHPANEPLELFYPPKWGVNERLPGGMPAQLQLVAA
jgi:hypothetical protein